MKIKNCRICKSQSFEKLFGLGKLNFTGKFAKKKNIKIPSAHLNLVMCKNCKLVQLDSNFNLKFLYAGDYGYRTGINQTMTSHVKNVVIEANKIATQSVFVSEWLMNLYIAQGITSKDNTVIYAGADEKIFNRVNFTPWNKKEKLKIVTHHWGANWNKGFETYLLLDSMISSKEWKDKIEFTYIGNIPKNANFKNSHYIEPLSGEQLANEIKKHHIYITGSLNEPSGNHHIEGAQCGLPIMYINSGGTPEYAKDYGIDFKNDTLSIDLKQMIFHYDFYIEKVKKYKFSSLKMCEEYLELFEKLLLNRAEVKNINNYKKTMSYSIQKKFYFFLKNVKKN